MSIEDLTSSDRARMHGRGWRDDAPIPFADLVRIRVRHHDFAGREQTGVLIVHRSIAPMAASLFDEWFRLAFPIHSIKPIEDFDGSDERSMAANNSSGFCARPIAGSNRWSRHSYGMAIDINPLQNPFIPAMGHCQPEAGREFTNRGLIRPGMFTPGSPALSAALNSGATWGGHWKDPVDLHHFEWEIDDLS